MELDVGVYMIKSKGKQMEVVGVRNVRRQGTARIPTTLQPPPDVGNFAAILD